MTKIIILLPFFGRWPEWINLFMESCKYNPTVDWLFLTDCGKADNRCQNVRYVEMSWEECRCLISDRLHISFKANDFRKLCDIRPAFGIVFAEYITGYDFFGFGDIDIIHGNLRKFLTPDAFEHDLITTNNTRVNGHFCLMRNAHPINEVFRYIKNWKKTFKDPNYLFFDETNKFYGIKRVYAKESFNTPLSPYIPWLNGKYKFPAEWYWNEGRLWNNLAGEREFLYLHFMRLKFHWQKLGLNPLVHFNYNNAPYGWKINLDGFFALGKTGCIAKNASPWITVKPQRKNFLQKWLSRP